MVLQLMLPLLVGLINLLEYMIISVVHPAQHPSLVKHRRAAVISKYLAFINCFYMTLVRYTVGARGFKSPVTAGIAPSLSN